MGKIEYRELTCPDEFRVCVSLQREIFKLVDIDVIPVAIMSLFAKKVPPIGIVIGAVDKSNEKDKIVGFLFNTAALQNNTICSLLGGVLPEYQKKGIIQGMFYKLQEWAQARDIKYMYGVFDPLKGVIGNAYIRKLGFWGVRYQAEVPDLTFENPSEKGFPQDNVVVKWDFNSDRPRQRIKVEKKDIETILSEYPIVNDKKFEAEGSKVVLVEIPGNIDALIKTNFEEALNWRLKTRTIFEEYINKRKYWITEFFSHQKDEKRHNYYLLQKLEELEKK